MTAYLHKPHQEQKLFSSSLQLVSFAAEPGTRVPWLCVFSGNLLISPLCVILLFTDREFCQTKGKASLETKNSKMKNLMCLLVVSVAFSLVIGCDGNGAPTAPLPTRTPQPANTPAPMQTTSMSACPPANAEGTVPPAIAICSITFTVNGLEQVMRDGDTLQASRGDEVQVKEMAICAEPFSGNGGEACVDFVPVDHNGQEIVSERRGTHAKKITSGCKSVPGPDGMWTIGENWRHISVVVNHWPPGGTDDSSCAGGLCERDDRVTVGLR